jgi:hypothetical protein
MNPDDERESFWKAVHTVDDRVTALEATVRTRNELMSETIHAAVREAMPTALLSDDEHQFLKNLIVIQSQRVAFRRKIIEGAALWSVLGLIAWALLVLKEYIVNHGWKP